MRSVGIVGFGSFGKFLAEKLSAHCKVYVFSEPAVANSWATDLETVGSCDFVVLAVPLQSYRQVVAQLKPFLHGETVVVDVCSVKEKPVELLGELLPEQPKVFTHPMFGPESASVSTKGHTLVMCPDESSTELYKVVRRFAESLGLQVLEMTAAEHDKEIAVVQGLTFFVARALENFGLEQQALHTPSFARLLHLAELEKHHSHELFQTIQQGNKHTKKVRQRFVETLLELERDCNKMTKDITR